MNKYQKIILVDLMWAVHTYQSVLSSLSVKIDGEEIKTGGIYGILKNIVFPNLHPDVCIVFCEDNHSVQRRKDFEGYKADRKPSMSFVTQLSLLKTICLSIPGVYYVSGRDLEGDDVISILAYRFRRKQIEIYSRDTDMLQCLSYSDSIKIRRSKSELIGSGYVLEKYGVGPDSVVLLRSIEGDMSDNIPPAGKVRKSLRIETALYYKTYWNLELSSIVPPQIRTILPLIERNWKLMKLPIVGILKVERPNNNDGDYVINLLDQLKMNSIKMEYCSYQVVQGKSGPERGYKNA